MSFRGIIEDRGYRIDCETSYLLPWKQTPAASTLDSGAARHIVALSVRGIKCPNSVMVYCKYRSSLSLPLGLLPGSITTFHNFSLKSSVRSNNAYFIISASSSITVESINTLSTSPQTAMLEEGLAGGNSCEKSYGLTREMIQLPGMFISELTNRLLQGCLSREIVCLSAVVMAVQHSFIQYQCCSCQCTMVDGECRKTCPAKTPSLNTDAR